MIYFYLLTDSNQLTITENALVCIERKKKKEKQSVIEIYAGLLTLNAKVQVLAWLSTSFTQLCQLAFLELWMFRRWYFMSLETLFIPLRVQTGESRDHFSRIFFVFVFIKAGGGTLASK